MVGKAGCVPNDASLGSFQDFVTFIAGMGWHSCSLVCLPVCLSVCLPNCLPVLAVRESNQRGAAGYFNTNGAGKFTHYIIWNEAANPVRLCAAYGSAGLFLLAADRGLRAGLHGHDVSHLHTHWHHSCV